MDNTVRSNKKRRHPAYPEGDSDRNLCYHCQNLAICSFVKNSKKPILYCEEYSGYQTTEPLETMYAVSDVPDVADLSAYTGLCATCENVGRCILKQQEGGVWQCNEYR